MAPLRVRRRHTRALRLQGSVVHAEISSWGAVCVAITFLTSSRAGIMLPYPPTGALTWDLVFLALYFIIENTRIFQGRSSGVFACDANMFTSERAHLVNSSPCSIQGQPNQTGRPARALHAPRDPHPPLQHLLPPAADLRVSRQPAYRASHDGATHRLLIYRLRLEEVSNGLAIALICAEMLLSILTLVLLFGKQSV